MQAGTFHFHRTVGSRITRRFDEQIATTGRAKGRKEAIEKLGWQPYSLAV